MGDAENVAADTLQDKARRIFTYLREMVQLRTPTIRDLNSYEEVLWFDDIPNESGCFSIAWGAGLEGDEDVWIKIPKQKEPALPPPPKQCEPWVRPASLADSKNEPTLLQEIIAPTEPNPSDGDEPRPPKVLRLSEHPEVQEAWLDYLVQKWEPWSREHKRWAGIHAIYARLFRIYQQAKRFGESYELLVGIGLLTWKPKGSSHRVYRHVLTARAEVEFVANSGALLLKSSEQGANLALENDMLEPEERPDPDVENSLEESIRNTAEEPWNREAVDYILKTWIHGMSPDSEFVTENTPPRSSTEKPTIVFAPAIILRKRTARTFVSMIQKIVNQINAGTELPEGVAALCEVRASQPAARNADGELEISIDPEHNEVYFPLPANDAQKEIVERLQTSSGVLVQGPPGTGKSHTIANLICHLLATGNRVLVTAETPRALQVLKGKIPSSVGDLCVSVLGSDAIARRELEKSVAGITGRYSNWNSRDNAHKISALRDRIFSLRKELTSLQKRSIGIREAETRQHSIASARYTGTAEQIARRMEAEAEKWGYIPDKIPESHELPCQAGTLHVFLERLRRIDDSRLAELQRLRPSLRDLISVEEFVEHVRVEHNLEQLHAERESFRTDPAWEPLIGIDRMQRMELADAVRTLQSSIRSISKRPLPWISEAVEDVLADHDRPWVELHESTERLLNGLRRKARDVEQIELRRPAERSDRELLSDAEDLLSHLGTGKGLGWGWFRGKIAKRTVYITREVALDGRPCDAPEQLRVLAMILRVRIDINAVEKLWGGKISRSSEVLSVRVAQLEEEQEALSKIMGVLDQHEATKRLVESIPGLSQPAWHDHAAMDQLLNVLDAIDSESNRSKIQTAFSRIESTLHAVSAKPTSSDVAGQLLDAVRSRNVEAYAKGYEALKSAERDSALLKEGQRIRAELATIAPQFVFMIEKTPNDEAWEGRFAEMESAWNWARASDWLSAFANSESLEQIQSKMNGIQSALAGCIEDLAAEKAWGHCFDRMTEHQRQHLVAWQKSMKKIGKGTGKHAEKHRRDARKSMEECSDAIPAWIMPLYRVSETVEPKPGMFDVVIVDEASQCGPEALMLYYLAKKCIVVGDDQQITPMGIGTRVDAVTDLARKHLTTIPHSHLYDPSTSLYAHADLRFGNRIPLREHFRCVPEIIRFSNDLCYAETPLIPLRQYPPVRLDPLKTTYVEEGFREGDQNVPEADAIADRIQKCIGDLQYDKKTFGVITLQGTIQAKVIQQKLLERIGANAYEERNIVCGDSSAFQGDERDVIFLSMVASTNMPIGAFTKEDYQRRFNVAASRARDQAWLFHSVMPDDLNPQCMRHRLLSYYLDPAKADRNAIDWTKCESEFEREVGQMIAAKGFHVIPQFEPLIRERYRIDLVVEGQRGRLAVECDGDHWHGPEEFEYDMHRQRQLERCDWRFWRVRSSDFYRNKKVVMEGLWSELDSRSIHPFSATSAEAPPDSVDEVASDDSEHRTEQDTTPQTRVPQTRAQHKGSSQPALFAPGDGPLFSTSKPIAAASKTTKPEWTFTSIEEVPQQIIKDELLARIPEDHWIQRYELIQQVARALGFRRTGRKVKARVSRSIGAYERAGILMQQDGNVRLNSAGSNGDSAPFIQKNVDADGDLDTSSDSDSEELTDYELAEALRDYVRENLGKGDTIDAGTLYAEVLREIDESPYDSELRQRIAAKAKDEVQAGNLILEHGRYRRVPRT